MKKSKEIVLSKNKPVIFQTNSSRKLAEQFKTQLENEDNNSVQAKAQRKKLGEEHPFDYEIVEGVVIKFGLANAIIDKITDFTIGPGMYIESEDEDAEEFLETFIDQTHLNNYLKPWFKEGLSKGAGYLEIAGLLDKTKKPKIKCANSNSIFVKRNKFGEVTGFNQYLGNNKVIREEEIISLNPKEIIQLNINQLGNSAYGQGIIYSALPIIDDFLLAQKSIHKLTKRKANVPIHAKLGDIPTGDYPSQEDIEAFGTKLQYMNETTEWVTGPNAEFKVIDFGNIGDKFTTLLDNDYKLLSYCFQVPETILGAGNVPEGLAKVQIDAFTRRTKSYQDDIALILREKVFNPLLQANGLSTEYTICWGESNSDEENKKIAAYKEVLSVANLSTGMKKAVEQKIAYLMDIDYDKIEEENEKEMEKQEQDKQTGFDQQVALQKVKQGEDPETGETEEHFISESKGVYKKGSVCEGVIKEDLKPSEWLNTDITKHKEAIVASINSYEFKDLKAVDDVELARGYLTEDQVSKLREVFKEAISSDKTIAELKKDILEKANIQDLQVSETVQMNKEARADMIAKTELTRILNSGLKGIYEKAGTIFVKWDATLDERTCDICHELNNKVFDLYEMDFLPGEVHPNCRCSIEEVKTAEEHFKGTINEKLSPQEAELLLQKQAHITTVKVKKFLESIKRLNSTLENIKRSNSEAK